MAEIELAGGLDDSTGIRAIDQFGSSIIGQNSKYQLVFDDQRGYLMIYRWEPDGSRTRMALFGPNTITMDNGTLAENGVQLGGPRREQNGLTYREPVFFVGPVDGKKALP